MGFGPAAIVGAARVLLDVNSTQFTAGMAKAEAQFDATTGRMRSQGASSSAATAGAFRAIALGAGIAGLASTKMALDFEESMSKIAGLVGASEEQVESYKQAILRLAPEAGKSPKELADALYFITSSGLSGAKAIDALTESARASTGGLGEVEVIADALTSAMNAYEKSGLSAADATDILVAAVREGKVEADALAPAIGKVLPTASALGITFADVAGSLAVLSKTGTDAQEGVVQLNAVMSSMLSTSPKVVGALKSVGLTQAELREVAAGPDGLIGVFRLLDKAFGGNVEAMRLVFPNVRAFRALMNGLAQEGKGVDRVLRGVKDATGSSDKAFDDASKTGAVKLRKELAKVQVEAIKLGDALIPVATKMASALTSVIPVVRAVVRAIDTAVEATIGWRTAILALTGAVVIRRLLLLAATMAGAGTAAQTSGGKVGGLKAAIMGLRGKSIQITIGVVFAAGAYAFLKKYVFEEGLGADFEGTKTGGGGYQKDGWVYSNNGSERQLYKNGIPGIRQVKINGKWRTIGTSGSARGGSISGATGDVEPGVLAMGEKISGAYGGPLNVMSGNRPGSTTPSGRPSLHRGGNAIDIGEVFGETLIRVGQAALISAGMPAAQARKYRSYSGTVNGWEILFNVEDHFNHVHIGWEGVRRSGAPPQQTSDPVSEVPDLSTDSTGSSTPPPSQYTPEPPTIPLRLQEKLLRAQVLTPRNLKDDLKALEEIERYLEKRLDKEKDINKRLELLSQLGSIRDEIGGTRAEMKRRAKTSPLLPEWLTSDLQSARKTPDFADDLAALEAIERWLTQRIKHEKNINERKRLIKKLREIRASIVVAEGEEGQQTVGEFVQGLIDEGAEIVAAAESGERRHPLLGIKDGEVIVEIRSAIEDLKAFRAYLYKVLIKVDGEINATINAVNRLLNNPRAMLTPNGKAQVAKLQQKLRVLRKERKDLVALIKSIDKSIAELVAAANANPEPEGADGSGESEIPAEPTGDDGGEGSTSGSGEGGDEGGGAGEGGDLGGDAEDWFTKYWPDWYKDRYRAEQKQMGNEPQRPLDQLFTGDTEDDLRLEFLHYLKDQWHEAVRTRTTTFAAYKAMLEERADTRDRLKQMIENEARFRADRYGLIASYASNIGPTSGNGESALMRALGGGPGASFLSGAAGGGKSYYVIVNNNYSRQPEDPGAWSRSLKFQLESMA